MLCAHLEHWNIALLPWRQSTAKLQVKQVVGFTTTSNILTFALEVGRGLALPLYPLANSCQQEMQCFNQGTMHRGIVSTEHAAAASFPLLCDMLLYFSHTRTTK